MGKAELVLSAKSCGCCGEPIAATDIPAKTLDLTPKEKVTFRPLFAFVTPKAELVKHREIKGSAYIDFPVNRTELYPDYRRNPRNSPRSTPRLIPCALTKTCNSKP